MAKLKLKTPKLKMGKAKKLKMPKPKKMKAPAPVSSIMADIPMPPAMKFKKTKV